jgi:tetratricopeptide (TPR) repeat protein
MKHLLQSPVRLALMAAGLAATFCLVPPVQAQEPSAGDLRALRYYSEQGNEAAVEAELRRLRSAFPGWTPPADVDGLFSSTVPTEVGRIYDLIAAGDYAAARELIARTDAESEDWSPPPDMLALLSVSEAQRDFDAFAQSGDSEGVIRVARGIPALLSCERINNAWELAEAHLARGDTGEALRVYRAVIETCSDPDGLVATLEKADVVTSLEELAAMSDRAQARVPSAVDVIRSTEDRLRAGRGAERRWADDESLIALPELSGTRPVARPAERGTGTRTTAPAPAARSATQSEPRSAPAPSGQGGGSASAVQRAAEQGDWARCLALSANSTNASVVYQRGWCAYNLDRPLEALDAFRSSVRRLGSADQRRDAGYGLLLSMLSLKMTEQAAEFAAVAPLTRQQRINIEGQILDQRGTGAYERGEYARAIAFFRAHAALTGQRRRDLSLLEGYALLNSGDPAGARAIFEMLNEQMATRETRRALRSLD